jgi:hypothetical protein
VADGGQALAAGVWSITVHIAHGTGHTPPTLPHPAAVNDARRVRRRADLECVGVAPGRAILAPRTARPGAPTQPP